MGRRKRDEDPKYFVRWTYGRKSGIGKFWKRKLHKAERRAAKMKIRGKRSSKIAGIRGEVNWKGH